MLAAQVLGLGLGTADARAADTGRSDPAARTLGRTIHADDGGLLGATGPVLDTVSTAGTGAVTDLGTVLDQHLDTGELPLPGHRADRPDAFSLAAGLLSTVPPQARPADADRASRSGPADGRPGETEILVPARRGPADPVLLSPAASAAPPPLAGGPRPAPVLVPAPVPPAPSPPSPAPDHLALAAAPGRPTDQEGAIAVLIPIAAGVLLTAAAAYKHRGLPGGH
ncbi:hypothetical protein [Streptomyces sp. TLI_171]|uniref:hypothetical protein n=1 Tax=Streptomyces sp. TLI_171 TaxID=1938859 RepID=UPI000C5520CF|nr:hypothetical protein [Streptomyces sp. TLI_171]RKE19164.1 hypothetical protein BX266_2475 [Streptomyces sp. TLI_171]